MEPLSVQAYANHRRERGLPGGSRNAVEIALKEGRIFLVAEEPVRLLDPEAADADWLANTDADHVRGNGKANGGTFTAFKTEEMRLRTERRQLDLERERGTVHNVAECREHQGRFARTIRDRLLTIPTRVAAEFGADDAERIALERRIDEEIRSALEELGRAAEETD